MNEQQAFKALAHAIILQAVKDYRTAVKHSDKRMEVDCRNFFLSEWFSIMTNISGVFILEKLTKE